MKNNNNDLAKRLKSSMSFLQFVDSKSDESDHRIEYTIKERSWLATLRFHIRMTNYDSLICKLAMDRLSILNDLVESNLAGSFETKINLEIAAIEKALQADTTELKSIESQDRFMTGGILDSRGLQVLPGLVPSKFENVGVISPSNVFRTAHWNLAKEDSSFNNIEQLHHEHLIDCNIDETQAEAEERIEIDMFLSKSF